MKVSKATNTMNAKNVTKVNDSNLMDIIRKILGIKPRQINMDELKIDNIFNTFEKELNKLKDIQHLQNKAIEQRERFAQDKKDQSDKKIQEKKDTIESVKKAMEAEIKRIEAALNAEIEKTEAEVATINAEKERADRVYSRIEGFLK